MIEVAGERCLDLGGFLLPESKISIPDEGADYIERTLYDARKAEWGIDPIMGGAESFPFEGLDLVLNNVVRKASSTGGVPASFPDPGYLGLFTSPGATAVPVQTTTLASPGANMTEATGGGYARISIAASNWPQPATADTTGRRSTVVAPGISFAESSGSYTVPGVNGFFLCTALTGGVALFYSNFDSLTTINVNQAGFQVRIPPFIQFAD